jgi:hypothetical protein
MNEKKCFEIMGDFKIYDKICSCLICPGGYTWEQAQEALEHVLNNPPADCLGNIKIQAVDHDDCWWLGSCE